MFNFLKRSPSSKFSPGEVWVYKTRSQEEDSRLTILKIDPSWRGNIVHISLDNLKIKRPLPSPPEFITKAEHIPISEKQLFKSVVSKLKDGDGLAVENEGYGLWKEKGESEFTIPVAEIVDVIEKSLNDNIQLCSTCGKVHQSFSLSFTQPSYTFDLKKGNYLTEDLCVVDNNYFIRVMLYIPIINHKESFAWGVWVTQSKENFDFYKKHFRKDLNTHQAFGWLSNVLPGYEDTMNLKTLACFQKRGTRPIIIELGEADHQLYKDYVNGITIERAEELMTLSLA